MTLSRSHIMAGAARAGAGRAGNASARTRERILDGAMRAIARHGLSKLGMSEVSESAGVSRGTLYRYFPSREELLRNLAAFERERFQQRAAEALRAAPPGEARLQAVLAHVTRYVREHPAIQRVFETEAAFVLRYVRDQFPALRAATGQFLVPLLRDTFPVRSGVVTTDQLADWMTRMMVSAVLFPDPDPDALARGLAAVYGLHAAPAAIRGRAPGRRPSVETIANKGRR